MEGNQQRHWAEGLDPALASLLSSSQGMISEKHYNAYRATEGLASQTADSLYGSKVIVVEKSRE